MLHAFQWDLARQVERLDWLLAQLPRYAEWGYNELYLHLEDAVAWPSLPEVARADGYSWVELERLVTAAGRVGIQVVPIVNLLGHARYLLKVPSLRELSEVPEENGIIPNQLCPVHPRTLEVAGKLLDDIAPFCTAGKVHVGLDESFVLGRHPRSKRDIAKHGLDWHFAGYVTRLHELATRRNLRLGMWADMLYFLPGAIARLPADIIAYDWYYHPFEKHPRVEAYNFAERDLAKPLRARGIEYWGCPMNSGFRHEPLPVFGERLANIRCWWERCQRTNAAGLLITSWETSRIAAELPTVIDAAAASLWLNPGLQTPDALLEKGFARVYGPETARAATRAALAADEHPFAGYARWEINERWDVALGPSGSRPYVIEQRDLERLLATSPDLPAPLVASLKFRLYLARRDVFVRQAAEAVLVLRKICERHGAEAPAIRKGLDELAESAAAFAKPIEQAKRAAQAMWTATRGKPAASPNLQLLAQDARRLAAWRRWLKRATLKPRLVWGSTPVCGAWQLMFTVHNFAPALQQVIVQELQPDGTWVDLRSRYTIEFLAAGARPKADLRRDFSVPVDDFVTSRRVALRGVGQVRVSEVTLVNGAFTIRPQDLRFGKGLLLGKPAPKSGLPELD